MRPPGGGLGEGGAGVLREAGLRYCSPAGEGAGVAPPTARPSLALLPFQWRHVDATCLLPPLAPVREQMTGSAEPIDPDRLPRLPRGRGRRGSSRWAASRRSSSTRSRSTPGSARSASRRFLDRVAEARRAGEALGRPLPRRRRPRARRPRSASRAARPSTRPAGRASRLFSAVGEQSRLCRGPERSLLLRAGRRRRFGAGCARASWWGIQCRRAARPGGVHQDGPADRLDPGRLVGQVGNLGEDLGGGADRHAAGRAPSASRARGRGRRRSARRARRGCRHRARRRRSPRP